ncbi:FemAB family PEP-CTERM system-associated protein [Microvirga sp. SRT01]|uniref:FemAB family PEP-CTERM system-associated protein n=1 Tax=Sphingomonas longa TaxID=2778730 RepID=A0ABS2DBU6_9SPHN|nr:MULTISPECIES: FemAB family XrtA/PEP-CTERM system-associated protein [Alphaproteobacteria]MBM6578412.1 FemAB family PEP-CTERM system-associated protein [Sphingomonas sp. BT552]MBR7711452.1 FemAB family PEP-CTERM system-associated protein [Microvirga sp. SRT01]
MPLVTAPLGIREAALADPGEAARIDAFVRNTEGATPFHLTGWSRAVERGCRQRARYLVAERANGTLAGVLPLTEIRSLLFGKALVSTGFGVGGGVLGEGVEALAAGAWDLATRLGCPDVDLRGGPAPAGWTIDDTTYVGFVRALGADATADLAAIPRKQRAEVRRSLGLDLTVETGRDPATHHRVYGESVRNLGTPIFPPALFRAVLDELDADILTVRHAGEPVASVLSLYFGSTVFPYWGGGTAAARGLRANDRMYLALMSHARDRGCTRFDFGRSKTGTGAAAFKKNWGFDPVPLAYARRHEGEARSVNPQNAKYRMMVAGWKRLPLPVARLAGPWLSRGLG